MYARFSHFSTCKDIHVKFASIPEVKERSLFRNSLVLACEVGQLLQFYFKLRL